MQMKPDEGDPFYLRGSWFERLYWGGLALFLIALGVVMGSLGVHADEVGSFIFILSFLALMIALPLAAVYRSYTWLRIYQNGILIHRPFRPDRFLPWKEIAQIRSNLWGRTIVVADASGNIKARVYASLTNSRYFLGWLMEARPEFWEPEEGLSFRKSSLFSLFFLFGGLFELTLAATWGDVQEWGFWFFVIASAASLIVVLLLPQAITICGDDVLLHFPFRNKVVHASEITSIEAVHTLLGHIEIHRRKGSPIVLMFFSLGADVLFGFLWFWHASRTRPNLARASWGPGGVRIPHQLTTLPMLNPPDKQK
jgi:hypothetical protein